MQHHVFIALIVVGRMKIVIEAYILPAVKFEHFTSLSHEPLSVVLRVISQEVVDISRTPSCVQVELISIFHNPKERAYRPNSVILVSIRPLAIGLLSDFSLLFSYH